MMACFSPLRVRFLDALSGGVREQEVSCGHCLACRVRQQNDWMIRSIWHMKEWKFGVFATLTYGERHVPFACVPDHLLESAGVSLKSKAVVRKGCGVNLVRSLRRSDVRAWLKRCRLRYYRATGRDVSYMYVGEYGPKTFRPHYHILMFGIRLRDFNVYFVPDWQRRFGYVRYQRNLQLGDGAFSYTAKYASKPFEFECPLVSYDIVERPRKVSSNYYGYFYVDEYRDWHLAHDVPSSHERLYCSSLSVSARALAVNERRFVSVGGFHYSLPTYYATKLFGVGQDDVSALVARRFQNSLVAFKCARDYNIRFRSAQFLCPGASDEEVSRVLELEDEDSRDSQYRRLFCRCKKYYDKSAF